MDVLSKHNPDGTIENLRTIKQRFVTPEGVSPRQRDKKVFISHATKDEGIEIFQTCSLFFSTLGVPVFNPTTEFMKQDASKATMGKAAADAQVVIAALSHELFRSKWCLAELQAAYNAGVKIVPVFSSDWIPSNQINAWCRGEFD